MTALDRLASLGLSLPEVATPAGAYTPYTRAGALVFTAGQLPLVGGELAGVGTLGADVTRQQGAELARIAGLNVLAIAAEAAGDLDEVRVVKATVFVASAPGFAEQSQVADGASDLFAAVLGQPGVHARSAVGVASLPKGSPVEVEAVLEVTRT